ncbi:MULTISPECIES: hypothetical protein [Pseudomonas]|uniref:Uncharacterized protein n=1 Tax=Pseudomonas sessilinigenes TaxID=658629 RepID=A0ABX8MNV9_9PSED|nr:MULTISPECIES: hypothetical protein [Pseudomonas]AZC21893.1 hypothetical protein C4K39_0186 [Pseudomonas sessilinigenes]QXH40998.1 hypothetical protein KSS89_01915 [Pseudomonas sessilinigenes]UMZ12312.1 hypothetical protein I9018_01000 [Pseudomonas sp. MPFS]
MANEDLNALEMIQRFAEAYLKRPLTQVESQVLDAFIRDKPLDFSQNAQQSVEQARKQAMELIRSDSQRTRSILDQVTSPRATDRADPQARELVLSQLLAAIAAQGQAAPAPPEPAGPVNDPTLRAMVSAMVQAEVKNTVEKQLAELTQKVEEVLRQSSPGNGRPGSR